MEAWDVIVLGDGPAALHAAAEAAKSGASTLLMSSTGLGDPGLAALDGLSASLQESNNRSHREDTIRCGDFSATKTSSRRPRQEPSAKSIFSSAEASTFVVISKGCRWCEKAPATNNREPWMPAVRPPTVSSTSRKNNACGTASYVAAIRSLLRWFTLQQSVEGLVALDMINGRIIGLQCKALIVADGGFEGAFSTGVIGLGMDMAFEQASDCETWNSQVLTL